MYLAAVLNAVPVLFYASVLAATPYHTHECDTLRSNSAASIGFLTNEHAVLANPGQDRTTSSPIVNPNNPATPDAAMLYLERCWRNQAQGLANTTLTVSFSESARRLYHSFAPWQTMHTKSQGVASISRDLFVKNDTITSKGKSYASMVAYTGKGLLSQRHGASKPSSVTRKDVDDYLLTTCRYTPSFLLHHAMTNANSVSCSAADGLAIYKLLVNGDTTTLFIDTVSNLIQKVETLHYNELYGDVLTVFTYSATIVVSNINIPRHIVISGTNGIVRDTIEIAHSALSTAPMDFQKALIDTVIHEEKPRELSEVVAEKYTENIHFLHLKHSDSRSLVVAFRDFLFVAEAPLNSVNGELIIKKAHELYPNKPIKYFAYGHFHNWYVGGARPFVAEGATILAPKPSSEYVSYILQTNHSLQPDRLSTSTRKPSITTFTDSLRIGDGEFEIVLYLIGEKSKHTIDYVVFYLPSEKLLFQGDLSWISADGDVKPASDRQAGLYAAIKELNLDVQIIKQSWPIEGHNVKNTIPFSELEKSVLTR